MFYFIPFHYQLNYYSSIVLLTEFVIKEMSQDEELMTVCVQKEKKIHNIAILVILHIMGDVIKKIICIVIREIIEMVMFMKEIVMKVIVRV